MKIIIINAVTFLCLLLPFYNTDALDCYRCDLCIEPFNIGNNQMMTCNSTIDSCVTSKVTVGPLATVFRGCASNCTAFSSSILSIQTSVTCCTRDRCNNANKMISHKHLVLVATLALSAPIVKLF